MIVHEQSFEEQVSFSVSCPVIPLHELIYLKKLFPQLILLHLPTDQKSNKAYKKSRNHNLFCSIYSL